eukprot:PhF_6_TR8367/c0_g1_i1/m.13121
MTNVSASYINFQTRSANLWNVQFDRVRATSTYLRIAATVDCTNCSWTISDSSALTYFELTGGAFLRSSLVTQRCVMNEYRAYGDLVTSSIMVTYSRMTSTLTYPAAIDTTWTDSYLLFDSNVMTTNKYKGVVLSKHVNGVSVHRYTNNSIYTAGTYGYSAGCVICYSQLTAAIKPSINDFGTLIFRRNTFQTVTGLPQFLYVIMNGGHIDYDSSNKAISYGSFYIIFTKTSFVSNVIVIANGGNNFNRVDIIRQAPSADAPPILSLYDTIAIINCSAIVVTMSFADSCEGLSLTFSNFTVTGSITVTLPAVSNSLIWFNR